MLISSSCLAGYLSDRYLFCQALNLGFSDATTSTEGSSTRSLVHQIVYQYKDMATSPTELAEIVTHLSAPNSPETIRWSRETSITKPYINTLSEVVKQQISPTIWAGKPVLNPDLDEFRMFIGKYSRPAPSQLPKPSIDDSLTTYLNAGFFGTLQDADLQFVKEKILEESKTVSMTELPNIYMLVMAYINQKDDVEFLKSFWSAHDFSHPLIMMLCAHLDGDSPLVPYGLSLVEKIRADPTEFKPPHTIPNIIVVYASTFLQTHKSSSEVNRVTREIIKSPGVFYHFVPQLVYSVKTTGSNNHWADVELEDLLKRYELLIKIINEN